MTNNDTIFRNELRNEIGDCNQAIKAFNLGLPHLAPVDLQEAPSVKWLKKHKQLCVRQINGMRGLNIMLKP
tara:strand:- start:102 stop:314 length:213 start_codon:yes stop_codon:yes gene_type:complete